MSPLWRDELGAYLSPYRLCLVRMKRGVRPTPVAEHEQRLEGVKGDSFGPALEAFAAMLAQSPWQGTATRVVIADHWARYAIVPWVAALGSAQERLAHGRQLLAGLYVSLGQLLHTERQLIRDWERGDVLQHLLLHRGERIHPHCGERHLLLGVRMRRV